MSNISGSRVSVAVKLTRRECGVEGRVRKTDCPMADAQAGSEEELSEEESAAFDEFEEELVAGRKPDIRQFLSRHPAMARRLRPLCETAQLLYEEMQRCKRKHPGQDRLRR
jgi:hypothetical protein